MTEAVETVPYGTHEIDGVVHKRSPHSVEDTVGRLTEAITGAGAKVFVVVDHSGEAQRAGLSLRDTKLVIFGSPMAGTPLMQSAPVVALDLPLKVLVWSDDLGAVWMTYLSSQWLAERHGVPGDLTRPLGAVEGLTSRVAGPA